MSNQELAQKIDGITPIYKTLKEDGPDHDKSFTVGVYVGKELKGTGAGHSKQEAQTNAAREGVKKYRKQHPEMDKLNKKCGLRMYRFVSWNSVFCTV